MDPITLDQLRMDTDFGAFADRQLEAVRAKTYDIQYPELKTRQFVPVDNSVDPGAETVKYDQYDSAGVAKLLSSYADDLPRADVKKKEFRGTIKGMGNAYGYSVQEMRAAKFGGVPLDQKRANAAYRAHQELADSIGFSGNTENSLVGFNGITNAQTITPVTKTGGGVLWSAAALGEELLADLHLMASTMVQATNGLEKPDTMILPIDKYEKAATKLVGAAFPGKTVLQAFLEQSQHVKTVDSWWKLTGAGASGTNRAICYKKDPDKLLFVIPLEMVQHPAQQRNLEWVVPCESRIGGVQCFYPLSVGYMDGI